MATYLTADQHFGHSGIIGLCNRPFGSVEEMNDAMREAWNSVVKPGDSVIHLGDFAHHYPADKLPKLFASLNGRKHLISGNHDDKATKSLAWESIRDIGFVSVDSQKLVVCHYAMRTWPGIGRGAIMLYGHSHGRMAGNVQSTDVGVDALGFRPLRLNEIKARMAKLPLLVDPEARAEEIEPIGRKP
jgi:calcineurin-like phosphoesterase family protein